jgi:hypothetical protein
MFNVRLSKNIKSSTFEKASKSSHFRPDNQRQISLDLSHTCRIRKRLISLINFVTFLKIIRLTRCEYSKLDVCTISLHLQSFNKRSREDVLIFEERCAYIRREMCLYSKKCARITTLNLFNIVFNRDDRTITSMRDVVQNFNFHRFFSQKC